MAHRWQFLKDDGSWESYEEELSKQFDEKEQLNVKIYFFTSQKSNGRYCVDFDRYLQINLQTRKQRRIRRLVHVSDVPAAFDVTQTETTQTGIPPIAIDTKDNVLCYILDENKQEYQTILRHFHRTGMQASHFHVIRIYKVVQGRLVPRYNALKETKSNSADYLLFHGTSSKNIEPIVSQGFDSRVDNKNGTKFGQGSYFALDSRYSAYYSGVDLNHPNNNSKRLFHMFVARVIVGKYAQGKPEFKRPPPLSEDTYDMHDSVVDDVKNPSMVVTFDNAQSIPGYIISFCRNTKEDIEAYSSILDSFPFPKIERFGIRPNNQSVATVNNGNKDDSKNDKIVSAQATLPTPVPAPLPTLVPAPVPAPAPLPTLVPVPVPVPAPLPTLVPAPVPAPFPTLVPAPVPAPLPTLVPASLPTRVPSSFAPSSSSSSSSSWIPPPFVNIPQPISKSSFSSKSKSSKSKSSKSKSSKSKSSSSSKSSSNSSSKSKSKSKSKSRHLIGHKRKVTSPPTFSMPSPVPTSPTSDSNASSDSNPNSSLDSSPIATSTKEKHAKLEEKSTQVFKSNVADQDQDQDHFNDSDSENKICMNSNTAAITVKKEECKPNGKNSIVFIDLTVN